MVNSIDPHGITYLIRDVVASALGETDKYADTVPVVAQTDSLQQDFEAMRVRSQPQGQSSFTNVVAATVFDTEEELDAPLIL